MRLLVALALILPLAPHSVTLACSDFRLNASHADVVVSARTMDFAADLTSVVEVIPRGAVFQELPVRGCPECPDFRWEATHGFVALNMFGLNVAADGMNEKGLSAAELYLVGTQYPVPTTPTVEAASRTTAATIQQRKPIVTSLCSYILGNFANVDEVRRGLERVQIAEYDERIAARLVGKRGDLGRVPLHISVRDASGQNLVLEFLDGNVTLYDNANQVLTNDPPLPAQLAALDENGFSSFPGGYGSTERFVRLSVLNRHVPLGYQGSPANASYLVATDEQRGVADALHLLNTVVRPPSSEATEWSIVRDHGNRKLYLRSTVNQVLRQVDLNQLDFAVPTSRRAIPVTHGSWFVDMTSPLLDASNTQRTVDLPGRSKIEALLGGGLQPTSSSSPLLTPVPSLPRQDAVVPTAADLQQQQEEEKPTPGLTLFLLGCVCGSVFTSIANVARHHVLRRMRQRGYAAISESSA